MSRLDAREAKKSLRLEMLAKKWDTLAAYAMSETHQTAVGCVFDQVAEATRNEEKKPEFSVRLINEMKCWGNIQSWLLSPPISKYGQHSLSWSKKRYTAELKQLAKENPGAVCEMLQTGKVFGAAAASPADPLLMFLYRDNSDGRLCKDKNNYDNYYTPTPTVDTLFALQKDSSCAALLLEAKKNEKSLRLQALVRELTVQAVSGDQEQKKEEALDLQPTAESFFANARVLLNKNPPAALALLNRYFFQKNFATFSPDLAQNKKLTAELGVLRATTSVVVDSLFSLAKSLAEENPSAALALLDDCLPQAGSVSLASDKQQLMDMYALKAKVIAGLLFVHARNLVEAQPAVALGLLDACLTSGSVQDSTLLAQMTALKAELSAKGVVAVSQPPQPAVAAVVEQAVDKKDEDVSQDNLRAGMSADSEDVAEAVVADRAGIPDTLRCLLDSAESLFKIPNVHERYKQLLIESKDAVFSAIRDLAKKNENKQAVLTLLETALSDEDSIVGKLLRVQTGWREPSAAFGTWEEMVALAKKLRGSGVEKGSVVSAAQNPVPYAKNQYLWWDGKRRNGGDPNTAITNLEGDTRYGDAAL